MARQRATARQRGRLSAVPGWPRMTLLRRLGDYTNHPDPLTAACNRIALLVVANQPFYPLYLWWIVGSGWRISVWTFLSTPFFAAVPSVARRNARAGRAMLPLTGIANAALSTAAFGESSGVAMFLIPCGLIVLCAFRDGERRITIALLALALITALAHSHYGSLYYHFAPAQYARFRRLNATSAGALSIVILWSLIRARASGAPQKTRPTPPRPSPPCPSKDPPA